MKNKNKLFRLILILSAWTSVLYLTSASIYSFADEETPLIPIAIVIKGDINPGEHDAFGGFKQSLREKNIKADFKVYAMDNANIFPSLRAQKPHVILTYGAPATRLVAAQIKDIPIVYVMLMDPPVPEPNSPRLTGASVAIPAKIQLDYLLLVLPGIKRIGLIYSQDMSKDFAIEARKCVSERGLILKTHPVVSPTGIPKINEMGIDLLWLVPDTIVCQIPIIKRILLSSIKERIPVMGISGNYVKSGALLALECDYYDIGKQAGEICIRILRGEPYSNVEPTVPRKVKLFINKTVADRMGIPITSAILEQTEKVYGQ